MRASTAAESTLESRGVLGVITAFLGASAALVCGLVLAAATGWATWVVACCALAFGLLVAVLARLAGRGPIQGRTAVAGRVGIAVAVGVVVGELAALAVFSGTLDRTLQESAARSADAAPAVVRATADLAQSRAARAKLDTAVDESHARLDEALVVARCEYNPSADCPRTHITGIPGRGPETLTANELLADARQELDSSLQARALRAPELDAAIAGDERRLGDARATATGTADRGLGARWIAMQDHTMTDPGALLLRAFTIAFFVLLSLLPLILNLLGNQTVPGRRAAAAAQRERAELEADTAIAVKRADVRRAAEILRADQQLASVRLAVEAQQEIDRALHRRRIAQAIAQATKQATAQAQEDLGAEAHAVDRQQLESAATPALPARAAEHPPATVSSGVAERSQPSQIPSLPDLTRSAARWIRPLVPGIVVKAIDSTAHPVRTARQVFEEVEEIHLSLRRTHTVTLQSADSSVTGHESGPAGADDGVRRVDSEIARRHLERPPANAAVTGRVGESALGTAGHNERELPEPDGMRQLPPAD